MFAGYPVASSTPAPAPVARPAEVLPGQVEAFAEYAGTGRLRVTFPDRKMAVPGKVHLTKEGHPILVTNWGLEIDLGVTPVSHFEVRDIDTGRYVR